jgi:hypothetical protein
MHHFPQRVNTRGWRRLPPADLENLILAVRRSAVRHHLSSAGWRQVDRMRRRLRQLLQEAA